MNKGTVFEVLLPVSAGLILATLAAVAIGLGVIVLRQPYVMQPDSPSVLSSPSVSSPLVSSLGQVPKSKPLSLQWGALDWQKGQLSEIPPPVVTRVINGLFKLLDPAQQIAAKNIPLSLSGLSQKVFPFSDARPLIKDVRVKRPTLTSDIYNYEPVDEIGSQVQIVPGHYLRLYWFNQLEKLRGERVFHSWYYKNTLMSRVEIKINSQKFRASSYKTILPHQQGQWRVVTETLDEQPLATHVFDVSL